MPTIFGINEPFSVRFGATLKSLRQERRIPQQKLTEAAGAERNYIYYLEKGTSEPTLSVLMGLAAGLGLTFSDFATKIKYLVNANNI